MSSMTTENVDTLIIGAGQAGVAMSEHLGKRGVPHLAVERGNIAQRWRAERWDSLVANGPAWHDRFPNGTFDKTAPDGFASRAQIVDYFESYATQINMPIRCGVEIRHLRKSHRRMPDCRHCSYRPEPDRSPGCAKNVAISD